MEKKELRVIIAGSRDFVNYVFLKEKVDEIMKSEREKHPWLEVVIVSGGARGVDRLGERYARERNLKLECFLADWNLYGKQAGMVRNRQMLTFARKEHSMLIAFWDGISRGTKNMIQISLEAGIDIHIVPITT